jgi:hypothetical protein
MNTNNKADSSQDDLDKEYKRRFEIVEEKLSECKQSLKYFVPHPTKIKVIPVYTYVGFFDGASKFNPGKSGAGYFLNYESQSIF